MSAIALALSCTGLAALALSMNRHARDVLQRELLRAQRVTLRIIGWGLLSASLVVAITTAGWPIGMLEWLGMVTASGLLVVLALYTTALGR